MTRARRQLVVVGDTVTLSSSKIALDRNNPYFIDRAFLEDWVRWLKKQSEMRQSKKILRL